MNEIPTRKGREVLARQPFGRLLGIDLVGGEPGNVVLRLPIREELKQHYGSVHGGVVAALADTALTFAGGSVLGGDVVTAGFTISFLRPAAGGALIARAEVIHHGRSQAVCRCSVFVDGDEQEQLRAVAQGTIVAVSRPPGA